MNVPREELLATRYERIFTYFLDAVIAAVIAVVLGFLLTLFGMPSAVYGVLGLLVGLLYAPLFMIRQGDANGQTPGKQLLGLRVVKDDGTPMDLPTALLRESLLKYILAAITFNLFLVLSWALSLGRSDHRMLQDRMAKTIVTATEKRWMVAPDGVVAAPR